MARLRTVRYAGLAAAVLLAVVGGLGGALPHADLHSTPISIARGPYGPFILGGWLVGTAVLVYAWWAARHADLTPRWVAVTAGLWALPFLLVPPMGSRDVYSYACQGYLYLHGLNPYAYGIDAGCPWSGTVSQIWRDTAAPYGPLFLVIAGGVVRVAGGSMVAMVLLFRLVALLSVVAVAAGVVAIARRCAVPESRALWVALAGPLIGAHLIAGPHNDAVMIGLLVLGLASRRAWLAGLLIGLAVAVKVTAIVVLPFAFLLFVGWRPRTYLAGGFLVSVIGSAVLSGLGFGWVGGMINTKDLVQFTSPPTAVGMTITYAGKLLFAGFDAVPVVRTLGVLLFLIIVAVLWLRSLGETPAFTLHAAGLALAACVALSPYFHPWYATWPLVVLAATSPRRPRLLMVVIGVSAFLVLPDGSGLARFVKFPGAPIVTILLIVLAVRAIPWRLLWSDRGMRGLRELRVRLRHHRGPSRSPL